MLWLLDRRIHRCVHIITVEYLYLIIWTRSHILTLRLGNTFSVPTKKPPGCLIWHYQVKITWICMRFNVVFIWQLIGYGLTRSDKYRQYARFNCQTKTGCWKDTQTCFLATESYSFLDRGVKRICQNKHKASFFASFSVKKMLYKSYDSLKVQKYKNKRSTEMNKTFELKE